MGIPYRFDPLGTLGAGNELPFVQPVMTSATTWSNEPSFGCAVTGYTTWNPAWFSMDGDAETYTIFGNGLNAYDASHGIVIALEKPLLLKKITVLCTIETTNEVYLFGGDADNEELLYFGSAGPREKHEFVIALSRNTRYSRYRLFFAHATTPWTWVYELNLDATYMP